VVERLGGRLVCAKCGANYHVKNIPPKKEGICDTCNIPLAQRKDDKPETIKNRLEIYQKSTAPLIDYYSKKGLLHDIDGDGGLESLRKELLTFFESLNSVR